MGRRRKRSRLTENRTDLEKSERGRQEGSRRKTERKGNKRREEIHERGGSKKDYSGRRAG